MIPDPTRSLAGGAVEPWTSPSGKWYQRELLKAARRRGIDATRSWAELGPDERRLVHEGDKAFPGIRGFFEEVEAYRYKLHVRVFLSRYRSQFPCPACRGTRLRPEALAVRVGGLSIAELLALTIEDAARFVAELGLDDFERALAREILRQLQAKLAFLVLGPMLDFKLYMMYTRVFRPRLIATIILSVVVQVLLYSILFHYGWEIYLASLPPVAAGPWRAGRLSG